MSWLIMTSQLVNNQARTKFFEPQIQPSFPVVFYLPNCQIFNEDKSKSFAIVQNGCVSDLGQIKRHSDPYASEMIKMSFKSFSFSRQPADYQLNIDCRVNFCLKTDQLKGDCGFDAENCSRYYSP